MVLKYERSTEEFDAYLEAFKSEGWAIRNFPNTEESREYIGSLQKESNHPDATYCYPTGIEFKDELFLICLPKKVLGEN